MGISLISFVDGSLGSADALGEEDNQSLLQAATGNPAVIGGAAAAVAAVTGLGRTRVA